MTTPIASPENVVQLDSARFTMLTSRMFRLEWAEDGVFEDRATLRVMNRQTSPVSYTVQQNARSLRIRTEHCTLIHKRDGKAFSKQNLEIRFRMKGKTICWWPGKSDPQNLKGTAPTLDTYSGDQCKVWVSTEEA
ncbi:MAG: glycosyl hydrolase family 31, partial [Kiritimatiellia bacterium]